MFVRVMDDGSLVYPYTLRNLKTDTAGRASYNADIFSDLVALAELNIFPVIDSPPAIGADQRLRKLGVSLVGDQYIQHYSIVATPSELEGGTRAPTSAELDADADKAPGYWRQKLGAYLDDVAASRPLPFGRYVTGRGRASQAFEGDIRNVLAYCDYDNFLRAEAEQLREWAASVWATGLTLERAWRGRGRTGSPTWADVLAQIPPPPAPPPGLVR